MLVLSHTHKTKKGSRKTEKVKTFKTEVVEHEQLNAFGFCLFSTLLRPRWRPFAAPLTAGSSNDDLSLAVFVWCDDDDDDGVCTADRFVYFGTLVAPLDDSPVPGMVWPPWYHHPPLPRAACSDRTTPRDLRPAQRPKLPSAERRDCLYRARRLQFCYKRSGTPAVRSQSTRDCQPGAAWAGSPCDSTD